MPFSSRIGIVLSAFCREIFREQAMALAMIAGFDSRFLRFVGFRKGFFNFFTVNKIAILSNVVAENEAGAKLGINVYNVCYL